MAYAREMAIVTRHIMAFLANCTGLIDVAGASMHVETTEKATYVGRTSRQPMAEASCSVTPTGISSAIR